MTQLTAIQAQVHGYARWSVAQRMEGAPSASRVDAAFADGGILRTHVLRPTWHYVAASDLGWLMRLSGPRVEAGNTSMYRNLELDARTFDRANDLIAAFVDEAPRTRDELFAMLESHGVSTPNNRGVHMLMHAELTGVICSGPMRGKQHTYAAFNQRASMDGPEGDEALGELAWRYFSTRGPATIKDFSWWAGLKMGEARRGLELAQSRLDTWQVDGRTYWFAGSDDLSEVAHLAHMVQCYDEAIISYSESRDLLQHPRVSFPVPRYIDGYQHVVLLDGQLLGHWRLNPDGFIETRILSDRGDAVPTTLSHEIERYHQFLAG